MGQALRRRLAGGGDKLAACAMPSARCYRATVVAAGGTGPRRAASNGGFDRPGPGGGTRVRLVHLEVRRALAEAYAAAGRAAPDWTDAVPVPGVTPIRAVHLMELRDAVRAPA